MTSYYVELIFNTDGEFDDEMEAHLDLIAEAFAEIADVDGDVAAHPKAGRVELCMTVDAIDRNDAMMKAFIAARTAVHAAGGGTATWDGWLPRLLDADKFTSSVSRSDADCTI